MWHDTCPSWHDTWQLHLFSMTVLPGTGGQPASSTLAGSPPQCTSTHLNTATNKWLISASCLWLLCTIQRCHVPAPLVSSPFRPSPHTLEPGGAMMSCREYSHGISCHPIINPILIIRTQMEIEIRPPPIHILFCTGFYVLFPLLHFCPGFYALFLKSQGIPCVTFLVSSH